MTYKIPPSKPPIFTWGEPSPKTAHFDITRQTLNVDALESVLQSLFNQGLTAGADHCLISVKVTTYGKADTIKARIEHNAYTLHLQFKRQERLALSAVIDGNTNTITKGLFADQYTLCAWLTASRASKADSPIWALPSYHNLYKYARYLKAGVDAFAPDDVRQMGLPFGVFVDDDTLLKFLFNVSLLPRFFKHSDEMKVAGFPCRALVQYQPQ